MRTAKKEKRELILPKGIGMTLTILTNHLA